MANRVGAGLFLAASLGLVVAACEGDPDVSTPEAASEALADAECDFRSRCCGDESGLSQSTSCTESATSRWARYIDDSSPGKGEYPFDPACAEPILALFGAPCDADTDYYQQSVCDLGYCVAGFYHGDKQEGEACFEGLECDGPYQCIDGYCQSPCGLQEGSLCANTDGSVVRACRPELYCDGATRVCSPFPVAGQACPSGICAVGAYCEPEITICRNFKQGGETCASSYECASQSCSGVTCEAVPGLGQDCSSLCTDGLTCIGGICSRLPGVGESCADQFICEAGLICDENVCVSPGSSGESLLCEAF